MKHYILNLISVQSVHTVQTALLCENSNVKKRAKRVPERAITIF